MRRILFPILVIGLTAGLFTLGSGAFFSDTERSAGNTFTTGQIDLICLTSTSGTTACQGTTYYTIAPPTYAYPGQALPDFVNRLTNNGNMVGDLYVKFTFSSDSCQTVVGGGGPFTEFCDTTADLVAGDINVAATPLVSDSGTVTSPLSGTTFATLTTSCIRVIEGWGIGDDATLTLTGLEVRDDAPNNRQGDRLTMHVNWELVPNGQSTTPAPTCPDTADGTSSST